MQDWSMRKNGGSAPIDDKALEQRGNQMTKPVRMALLVLLWVCRYLIIHSPVGSPDTLGPPELQMPGAKFGGITAACWATIPPRSIPPF